MKIISLDGKEVDDVERVYKFDDNEFVLIGWVKWIRFYSVKGWIEDDDPTQSNWRDHENPA